MLCQHILIRACAGPFDDRRFHAEVTRAGPYRDLTRADFDACLDFVATGDYALRAYDRWQRLLRGSDGLWRLRDIRMNIGTIQDTDTLKAHVKGRGGRPLGEVEEAFAASLVPGDSFLIGGRIARFESLRDLVVQVGPSAGRAASLA